MNTSTQSPAPKPQQSIITFKDLSPKDVTAYIVGRHLSSLSPERIKELSKESKHMVGVLVSAVLMWFDIRKLYASCLEREPNSYQTYSLVKAALGAGFQVNSAYYQGGELAPQAAPDDIAVTPAAPKSNSPTVVTRLNNKQGQHSTRVTMLGMDICPIKPTETGLTESQVQQSLDWYKARLDEIDAWEKQVAAKANELTVHYSAQLAELQDKQAEYVAKSELAEIERLKARLAELSVKHPTESAKKQPKKAVVKDLAQLREALTPQS